MTIEEIIHCKDCIFFEQMDTRKDLGFCHSQSPVILLGVGNKTGHFPIVAQNCYCGDAVRREQ